MSAWEGGKGSSRRPENTEEYRKNWERIFDKGTVVEESFWDHDCAVYGKMSVEQGEPCNWCGMTENGRRI